MILVEIVVVGLLSYRLWRLIAVDSITQPVRERIETRGFWWELVSCHWCLGTWVALGVAYGASAVGWLDSPWLLVGIPAAVVVGWLGDQI